MIKYASFYIIQAHVSILTHLCRATNNDVNEAAQDSMISKFEIIGPQEIEVILVYIFCCLVTPLNPFIPFSVFRTFSPFRWVWVCLGVAVLNSSLIRNPPYWDYKD